MYPYRIEICGGIASGKTTCANVLETAGLTPILEDFSSNPFWQAFYADPPAVAFETEVTFCLQHYHQIKRAKGQERPLACDYSLLLDLAYAKVTLSGTQLSIFEQVFAEVWDELSAPQLLVYLECNVGTQLMRIKRRARPAEEAITEAYLLQLQQALRDVISRFSSTVRVVVINSEIINFAEDQADKRLVTDKVLAAL